MLQHITLPLVATKSKIVGLGNPILSDDGVGIRVAQAVRERLRETEVEFLEVSLGGLRLAIGFEKDTLLFFYDLRDMASVAEQTTINSIIVEEKQHLRRLAKLL
jgi:hydrogenase maturation protease